MFAKLRAAAESPFLRQNLVFFIGSLLVGGFNYIYYPLLGRLMEPHDYGEVQALVALFMQLLIFLGVLSQVTVNIVANYTDETRKQRVVFELEKLAFMIGLGLLAVGCIASWQVREFFKLESVWPFITLLVVIVISVPLTFRTAYLRARQRFGLVSGVNVIGAAGKVALSALLVWWGWQTFGAIAGIMLAQVLSFGYAAYKTRQLGFMRPAGTRYFSRLQLKEIRPELKYAGFVFICSMAVMLLSSIDIFIVKHYFDPQTAGEYAGISTVARIIFFLTASISQVLLPAVKLANPAAENRKLLIKSFLFLSVTGGLAALIIAVFSTTSVKLLMGSDYLRYVELLPWLCLAMFLLSVINLVVSYYIALRKYEVLGIIVSGTCMTVILLWAWHDSVRDIVVNLIVGSIAMLGLFVVWRVMHLIRSWRSDARPKTHFNSNPRV